MDVRTWSIDPDERDLLARAIHKQICDCGYKRCPTWPTNYKAADVALKGRAEVLQEQ